MIISNVTYIVNIMLNVLGFDIFLVIRLETRVIVALLTGYRRSLSRPVKPENRGLHRYTNSSIIKGNPRSLDIAKHPKKPEGVRGGSARLHFQLY